jgi:hypothetical protein
MVFNVFDALKYTCDSYIIRQLKFNQQLSVLLKFDKGSFKTVNNLLSCIETEDTVNVLTVATI